MTKTVPLDNVVHKDLRVRTGYSAEFGDSINQVLIFPTEIAFVQREYPILFRKDSNGDLQAVALLGLDKDENLFLEGSRWKARYVPAIQQRGPFLIGFRQRDNGGKAAREPMVHVDLEHPRISETEGVPVFLRHGGNSPYLEHANRALQMIIAGSEVSKPMFAAFEEAGLVEPMAIEIGLDDRVKYKLPGFLGIRQERLAALDGATLESLNRKGFLHLAIHIVSSLGNVGWLVELKKQKRAAA